MVTLERRYFCIQLDRITKKIVLLCMAFLVVVMHSGCDDLNMLESSKTETVEISSPRNDVIVITEKFAQLRGVVAENKATEAYQLLFSIYDVDFRKWQQQLHQQNATETIKIELQFGQILEKLKGDIEPDKIQKELNSNLQSLMLAFTTQMGSLPEPEISVPEQPKEEPTPQ